MEVDSHLGAAMSGLTADARTLIDHARNECQNHRFTYNESMPIEAVAQSLCDVALNFDEDGNSSGMSRPFGVALLLAGHDLDHGPVLYTTDPSGTYVKYGAKAVGSGSEGAQNALQESYKPEMSLAEAETLALSVLKQVMEEKVTQTNVDIATVAQHYKLYTEEEVQKVIDRL